MNDIAIGRVDPMLNPPHLGELIRESGTLSRLLNGSAFRCILVLLLAACAGCTQLDLDTAMLADCPHAGTSDAGRDCVSSGNVYCSGSLRNDVCYGGYAIRAGVRGGGWVDSNTCEFDIREDTRITYEGTVIVEGPEAGNLSSYPPLCQ